jgi:WD40 repeat protein
MAYIEVWKSGKLLTRRGVDTQKAQTGFRVRLGSAGEVRVALGQPETLGDYEVRVFEGEPPESRQTDQKTASIASSDAQTDSITQAGRIYEYPDIEGYKIIEPLGEGGMGMVWRAEQLSTRREVALKLLVSHRADSAKAQARFQREVELTARLDHPNIARIYDSGLHHGMYYAMELIDGVPLDEYVKNQNFSRTQILSLMQKVCQAVLYAHLRAVIHRDLKPSNIIISPDGQPHILDFGLAKALLEEDDESLTISIEGQIAGTPAYMSPEQAAGHHNQLDTRTDVFSLGVILYELLTGQSPHDLSGSMFDLLRQIAAGNIRRLSEVDKSIDSELEAILLKALARNPEERYASAGALAKDIANYLDEEPLDARVPTTLYFLRKKAFKHKKQVGIAAAILFVVCMTVFTAYTRIIKERAVTRATQERSQLLEAELADLRTTILSGNTKEAEAALSALEEKYLTAQRRAEELQQKTSQGMVPVPIKRINLRQGEPLSPTALVRQPALPNGIQSWTLETTGHRGNVNKVAYSPDGRFLATATEKNGTVFLWDAHTWQPLYKCQICWISSLGNIVMSWSPDSSSLAIGGMCQNFIAILDVQTGTILDNIFLDQPQSSSIAWSPDGNRLATGHPSGTLQIWEVGSRPYKSLWSIDAHSNEVRTLAWTSDSHRLISAGDDGMIKQWNPETGRLLRSFDDHMEPVMCLEVSPDGTKLISGSKDDTFRLWNVQLDKSGRILIDVPSDDNRIYCAVAWSPDGTTLASGSGRGDIYIWNSDTGELMRSLISCCGRAGSVTFSPDGRFLVYGGANGSVQVFDAENDYQPYVVLLPLLDFGLPGFSVNLQGDYRGPPGIEEYLEYVIQTENGEEVLMPKLFANKYGWVNEPWQVGLYRPGLEKMDRIYVKTGAQGPYDGKDWETAFSDLQDALNVAQPGTEVWVAAGVYKPDRGTSARNASFQLRNGISLYGGFSGNETRRYERDPNVYETILSGDLKGDDGPDFANNEENSYHVIDMSGTNEMTVLDGFTVMGGNANGPSEVFDICHGGGIYNRAGSPTIINCTFRENSAIEGGGMYHDRGKLKLVNCTLIGNKADFGGGIYANDLEEGTFINCILTNNTSNKNGGGMFNDNSNCTLTNCKFTKNISHVNGGGLWEHGRSALTNCTFSENVAIDGGGGMFSNSGHTLILNNCIFIENSGQSRGGGILMRGVGGALLTGCLFIRNSAADAAGMLVQMQTDPKPTLINCAFIGNTAGDACGGLAIDNSDPKLMNCVFIGNKANRYSGAIHIKSGNPVLTNCTIVGNTVNGHGSGINNGGNMCNMTLTNCIVWGNTHREDDLEAAQIRGGGMSVNYCCVQDWSGKLGGVGNIGANPMFIDPDDLDVIIGTEDDNFHLSPNSPCLNTGDNSALPADTTDLDSDGDKIEPIPFDLEGKSRIINSTVDIGAYESD